MKSADMSSNFSSGFSYMDHMILPQSMAEPPPMAMMQSGWKAFICCRPSSADWSDGSGSTFQKLECTMPSWSSLSSMGLVKPCMYRNWSVTMKQRCLW